MSAVLNFNAFELESGVGNLMLENAQGVLMLESFFTPGVMPNLVGLLLQEALQQLEFAQILVPRSIGYFGTYPVTVTWTQPVITAGGFIFGSSAFGSSGFGAGGQATSGAPGIVNSQSIAAGTTGVVANTPITLNVNEFPFGMVFPAGGGNQA